MNIQIATFALVPDHLYIAEKYFHSGKVILILSDENDLEINNDNSEVELRIKEVENFYYRLDVPVEKIYVNYKDFLGMTLKLGKIMNEFNENDAVLLNLSGGRRSIPISLIYAGTFISNFKDINIQCVVIPEDKSYNPFNLIPNYIPDGIDLKLMSKITENLTLMEMEGFLGIKQPTISMRLKRLEKSGYIILEGRERELTDLGSLLVNINIKKLNENEERN